MSVLMIDNYDSFTFNIVQYLAELGADVEVVRNDAITLAEIEQRAPRHLVISPGPCDPDQAGISMAAIQHFAGQLPILGVCLGHQSIAQVFGAKVVRAPQVMHGKTSWVEHQNQGVFQGLANPLSVTRYHSLVVDEDTMPETLEVTARVIQRDHEREEPTPGLVMGLRHTQFNIEGVQFHPESILSQQGHEMLANFLRLESGLRQS